MDDGPRTTLLDEFEDVKSHEPQITDDDQDAFMLGAQAVLDCVRLRCPHPTTKSAMFKALRDINEEVAEYFGLTDRGPRH